MNKNEALIAVENLIEWLRENRDLSETIVTDNELEAINYLIIHIINTFNHGY